MGFWAGCGAACGVRRGRGTGGVGRGDAWGMEGAGFVTTCVAIRLTVSVPVLSVKMCATPAVATSPSRAMDSHEFACNPDAVSHVACSTHAISGRDQWS